VETHSQTRGAVITRNGARLIAFSGVVFSVLLIIVALVLTPAHAPNSASAGATIAHYFGAHRSTLLLGYFLSALSVLPLIVFIAALYRPLRRAEGDDGWVALTALIGGVVVAALFFVSTSMWATVAYRPGQDPAILRALTDAGWITVAFSEVAGATFIGAISIAVLRTRVLPAWSGWVGVLVAIVTLIGTAAVSAGSGAFSPQGSVALIGVLIFPLWVLVISVAAMVGAKGGARPSATG
jgi:hypothetical protein